MPALITQSPLLRTDPLPQFILFHHPPLKFKFIIITKYSISTHKDPIKSPSTPYHPHNNKTKDNPSTQAWLNSYFIFLYDVSER